MRRISLFLLCYIASGLLAAPVDMMASDTIARPSYVALKNNLLYDAAATPNLQLEVRLARHWSLQAGVGFNPFPLNDEVIPKWRHVEVELAPRYWFCEAFTRDFVSVNIAYAHYNVAGGVYPVGWLYKEIQTHRFQGDAVMFGASYGWHFAISPHFSVELEGGVDGGWTRYDKFTCVHCGKQLANERKWFAVPRLGVNLVVLLDGNQADYEDRCDCGKLQQAEQNTTQTTPIVPDSIAGTPIQPDTTTVSVTVEDSLTGQTAAEDTIPAQPVVVDTVTERPVEEEIIRVLTQDEPLTDYPAEPKVTEQEVAEPKTTEPQAVEPAETAETTKATEATGTGEAQEPELQEQKALKRRIYELEQEARVAPSDSIEQLITTLLDEQIEVEHKHQINRLRETILRPIEEFEPYNPEAVVTAEPNSIFMHFDVNITDVDRTFIHNDELLDSIMQVIADAIEDTTIEIKLIKIVGMASFDGSLKGNERLGASRAAALHDYIQERFGFSDDMFRVYNGGECWAELRWYLSQEEFPGKEDVLNIIDQVQSYDLRERFIKRHDNGRTYDYMRKHFKRYLRNLGTITVYYEVKDKK